CARRVWAATTASKATAVRAAGRRIRRCNRMAEPLRNPHGINGTLTASGREPISDEAEQAADTMREAMERMTSRERVVAFQVLTDYFCPHCGIEQPPGDCQCQSPDDGTRKPILCPYCNEAFGFSLAEKRVTCG